MNTDNQHIQMLRSTLVDRTHREPVVIGLHAPKGTGKDTTARGIIDAARRHGVPVPYVDYFARPLYAAASALTGMSVDWLQDQKNKNSVFESGTDVPSTLWGRTPRWLLERLGTEFVRNELGVDHWVELARQRVVVCPALWCIFTDTRFSNEAGYCHKVIELRRDGIEYGTENDHVSSRRLAGEHINQTFYLKEMSEEYYDDLLTGFLEVAIYGRSDPL